MPHKPITIEVFAAVPVATHALPDSNIREHRSASETDQLGWNLTLFDINYATAKQLRSMGFPNDFIAQWFRNKNEVGFVTSFQQFCGLDMLTEHQLHVVQPYLDFSRYEQQNNKPVKPSKVDLNAANAEDFQQLKGIGPVLSKRIVEYREKLGGYVRKEQLVEVYGIHDSVFLMIEDQLELSMDVRRVSLNQSDVKRLYTHPYIDYKRAQAIVRYRDQHGAYTSTDDLFNIVLIDSAWMNKLSPYLSL